MLYCVVNWELVLISIVIPVFNEMDRIGGFLEEVFMRKDYFESIGRFKEFQIMEDVDLARRIKKRGDKICILDEKVLTSARRWEKDGAVYGTLLNALLLILFYAGVKPERLVKFYRS